MHRFNYRHWLSTLCALSAVALQACGGGGGSPPPPPPPPPAITNINGAATASGTAGSSFIVYGSHFGNLSGTAMTAGYTVDFRDASSNAVVASASYAGSGWTDTYIKAVVPGSGLTTGTTYDVTVTTPNGTSNAVGFTVVAAVALSPSTIAWGATASLPAAIQGFPAIVAPVTVTLNNVTTTTDYIYTLGGNTAASGTLNGRAANISAVYSNVVNDGTAGTTAGTLANATWNTEANGLPAVRGFSAGVLANGFNSTVTGNGYVYVLGGLDDTGAAANTVYFAPLNSDGTIGAWSTTTSLPDVRYALGAVVFRDRLYVAGGNDGTDTPVATVYSAVINSDGTLGAWSTSMPSLSVPVAYHQLISTGGVLYVLGGTSTAAIDPTSAIQSQASTSAVYYNAIDPDGSLAGSSWTTNPSNMIKTVEKNSVTAIGSYVLASGGLYAGADTGSTEESYSTQSTIDDSLGSFQGATGAKTITGTAGGYNFFNHASALYVDPTGVPHVLILGGQTVGAAPTVQSGVWYMK